MITTTTAVDPYECTKERLLLLYAPSQWVMASRILHHPHLGDTRPSVLMSKMLALLPRVSHLVFFSRLPGLSYSLLRCAARSLPTTFADVQAMVAYTNRVWETKTAEVSVATLSLHNSLLHSPSPVDTHSHPSSCASSPATTSPTRLPR